MESTHNAEYVAPEVREMSRAVACLALALPSEVWDDVAAKWAAVLRLIDDHGAHLAREAHPDTPCPEPACPRCGGRGQVYYPGDHIVDCELCTAHNDGLVLVHYDGSPCQNPTCGWGHRPAQDDGSECGSGV